MFVCCFGFGLVSVTVVIKLLLLLSLIVAAGTSLSLVGSCRDNVESLQDTGERWPENGAAHPTKTDEFSPNR